MPTNQTYLIAGASSGIGLQLAMQLLECGHLVIGLNRNAGALEGHPNFEHIEYDFRSENPMPEINRQLAGIVYCPGSITLKPLANIRRKDLTADFEINVLGAFFVVQNYKHLLLQAANPSVLFFSSVAASKGFPFHASVSISKGAVKSLTLALAAELAPKIRVNCIAPSLTDTPLSAQLLKSEEKRRANEQRHPLKKLGTAGDIAKTAAFLLLDALWMTGQIIGVDGGISNIQSS